MSISSTTTIRRWSWLLVSLMASVAVVAPVLSSSEFRASLPEANELLEEDEQAEIEGPLDAIVAAFSLRVSLSPSLCGLVVPKAPETQSTFAVGYFLRGPPCC